MDRDEGISVAAQLIDELKLQAWLAKAELKHPSVRDVKGELDVLAQIRDELRLQLHLGRMEASDEWHAAEDRWRHLMHRAEQEAHDVRDDLRVIALDLRERYHAFRDA